MTKAKKQIEENKKQVLTSKELDEIILQIPAAKQALAISLGQQLTFMARTLDDLQNHVINDGVIEFFEQGSQKFYRESPALKGYNTTIQRYVQTIGKLNDLIPKIESVPMDNIDEFDAFVTGRDDSG